nr:Uncharacterised protein [Raoultella sp. NCTC 9187]
MPEDNRQAGGAEPGGGEYRHLANAGEGREHHDQIGYDHRKERQQQRVAYLGEALPRRDLAAVHHPLGQVVERVIGGNTDNAHAHYQRHQVQLAEQQQRGDGARQRADADGDQAQDQRTQRAKDRDDEQNNAQDGGHAEG